MLTRTEISTGLRNIRQIAAHPSLFLSLASGGRKSALKQAVQISLKQLKESEGMDLYSIVMKGEMRSLIGRVGGYSQELLYYIVRFYRPRIVVETGVYRGISSAFILKGIKDNGFGKLYSIDLPMAKYNDDKGNLDYSPLSDNEKTGFAVPDELRKNWTLILGDSREELPKLIKSLGKIDMFYHDSEHTYEMMMWEFNTVFRYLNDDGIICSDDISWNVAFQDFSRDHGLNPVYMKDKFGFSPIKG